MRDLHSSGGEFTVHLRPVQRGDVLPRALRLAHQHLAPIGATMANHTTHPLTSFTIGPDGKPVCAVCDAVFTSRLAANQHFAEEHIGKTAQVFERNGGDRRRAPKKRK
jgi:hypothetical protein